MSVGWQQLKYAQEPLALEQEAVGSPEQKHPMTQQLDYLVQVLLMDKKRMAPLKRLPLPVPLLAVRQEVKTFLPAPLMEAVRPKSGGEDQTELLGHFSHGTQTQPVALNVSMIGQTSILIVFSVL